MKHEGREFLDTMFMYLIPVVLMKGSLSYGHIVMVDPVGPDPVHGGPLLIELWVKSAF